VALNRVLDPSTAPSQILGNVSAQGKVFVINPNGIIFGAGSQVNVGALIASTADAAGGIAGQYKAFQSNTIYSQTGGNNALLPAFGGITTTNSSGASSVDVNGTIAAATDDLDAPAGSSIIVEKGAQISTNAPASSTSRGGFVMLLGSDVENRGSISAPAGQIVLGAGTRFYILPGYAQGPAATSSKQAATALGLQVAADEGQVQVAGSGAVTAGTLPAISDGSVANTGLLEATTGDITLVGQNVAQAGVAFTTTTTTQRGTIHLLTPLTDTFTTVTASTDASGNISRSVTFTSGADTTATVALAPGSLTDVAPDLTDPTTAYNSQRTSLDYAAASTSAQENAIRAQCQTGSQCPFIPLNDQALTGDLASLSRIEITSGGLVNFAASSLTTAQAGQIAVTAGPPLSVGKSTGKVFVAGGAQIDVSGVPDVVLPASANIIVVNIESTELRDDPANRLAQLLQGNNVYLDINQLTSVPASATDPSGGLYTRGGLLEVSGSVNNIGHTIAEWSTVGGSVTIAANQVVAQSGATVNLAGGSIDYQAGYVNASYLVGPGGAIYPVNTAPGNLVYGGVYNGVTISEPAWGVSTTYRNPLIAPEMVYQPAFTVGRDAGTLALSTPTLVFEGTIDAGVVTGTYQTQPAARTAATDPFQLAETAAPLQGSVVLGAFDANFAGLSSLFTDFYGNALQTPARSLIRTDVQLGSQAAEIADTLSAGDPVSTDRVDTAWIGTDVINGATLGGLGIATYGNIQVDAPLTLAPGATVTLAGTTVDVKADVTARGGTVTLGNSNLQTGNKTSVLPPSGGTATVQLESGAHIDARGVWTNLYLDPNDAAGAADLNGGTVTLNSAGAETLAAGSVIDVSAGGLVSAAGSVTGGTGGSITIGADDPNGSGKTGAEAAAPVTLAGTLAGYGMSGGGSLSIRAPAFEISAQGDPAPPAGVLQLQPTFFQQGFGSYALTSTGALSTVPEFALTPGTQLVVAAPSYVASGGAVGLPSGNDPASAYTLQLLPPFIVNPATATLTTRPGASVSFVSNYDAVNTKYLVADVGFKLGAGASISVDPGQSVSIATPASIDIEGSITAHGGAITVVDDKPVALQPPAATGGTYTYDATAAVWFGPDSRLDVSGIAQTAQDRAGRPFGNVLAGGSITVGELPSANPLTGAIAAVVIQAGAVFDASGTSAAIDPTAGRGEFAGASSGLAPTGAIPTSSNGGGIMLSSEEGIFIDGTLRAAAGGPGAAGGTLALYLDPQILPNDASQLALPPVALGPVGLTISATAPTTLPANLAFGDAIPTSNGTLPLYGQSYLGEDTIAEGGFGTLNLNVRGAITFSGNQTLHLPQEIAIGLGNISESPQTADVVLDAPYILLADGPAKAFQGQPGSGQHYTVNDPTNILFQVGADNGLDFINGEAERPIGTGTLTLHADRIDVQGNVGFGIGETYQTGSAKGAVTNTVQAASFRTVTLDSATAIQFDDGANLSAGGSQLVLKTAQIFPAGGGSATISSDVLIDVERQSPDAPAPTAPLQLAGNLSFYAPQIVQNGVIQAPLGHVTLGYVDKNVLDAAYEGGVTKTVELGPGSVTSVSAAGLTVPFGGTSDTISYSYDGSTALGFSPSVTLSALQVQGDAGSLIDLRGGGTLTGGTGETCSGGAGAACGGGTLVSQGFVAGRGGSTDVLVTPLLLFNPSGTTPPATTVAANGSNAIYAIVAGYDSDYAPTTALDQSAGYYGQVPAVGERITIGPGVPGLPAGTYTLLPSYFALLPGGFRVQLSTAKVAQAGALAIGNGSYQAIVYLGTANAGVVASLPQAIYVTPAAAVTQYSQYNQESYASFEVAQATLNTLPRPLLPQDAGQLVLEYPASPAANGDSALEYQGTTYFSGAGSDSYAGSLTLLTYAGGNQLGSIELTGRGSAALGPSQGYTTIDASQLDAFGAPRIVIGASGLTYGAAATISAQNPNADPYLITGRTATSAVVIDRGAVVAAPEVVVVADTGGITVNGTIDTRGQGAAPYHSFGADLIYGTPDNGSGNGTSATFLVVSNDPASINTYIHPDNHSGPITFGPSAVIATPGTLTWQTQGLVTIDPQADLAAATLNLAVTQANFGTPVGATLSDALTLTQAQLDSLVAGGLQQLNLTAYEGVTLYGGVTLNGLSEVEFNTPGIYGEGDGTASISVGGPGKAGTFVWNGLPVSQSTYTSNGQQVTIAKGVPQTPVAGGAGSGTGTLNISADTIVFGYGPNDTVPSKTTSVDRTMLGFGTVNFNARRDVTFNSAGTLTVYQQETGVSQTPAGGLAYSGTGGAVTFATPLVTGQAGAQFSLTSGGALTLVSPTGAATGTAQVGLGATLSLTAPTITDSSVILLPAGQATLTATAGNLALGAGAAIDVAGQPVTFFDTTKGIPGGSVVLESGTGNVSLDPNAIIDVSSNGLDDIGGAAGSISITATEGSVNLNGAAGLRGSAIPGQQGGSIAISALNFGGDTLDTLATNFAAGGFSQSVNLDIGSGDLVLSRTLAARNVSITASGGSLTVTGTIDASGATPGSIALAGKTDLLIAGSAVLDAHATVPQTDSYGEAIPASNRADVSLTAQTGTLTLASGATIDVSNATATPYGTVELYAPRLSGGGIAASVPGSVTIKDAASISLYAMAVYSGDTVGQDAGTHDVQVSTTDANGNTTTVDTTALTQAYFAAMTANASALEAQLAGLFAPGYAGIFHLRPGVEIDSTAPTSDLTVSQDLDLHWWRVTSLTGTEPGALFLRAGGSLNVFGSISDGFGTPPASTTTPVNQDQNGWVVGLGTGLVQSLTLPVAMTLNGNNGVTDANGNTDVVPNALFPNSGALNFSVTLANADYSGDPTNTAGLTINAYSVLPSATTLMNDVAVPSQGFITTAAILNPDGTVFAAAGTFVSPLSANGTPNMIPANSVLSAGSVLPVQITIATVNWPKGAPLSDFTQSTLQLIGNVTLGPGAILPTGTVVQVPPGQSQLVSVGSVTELVYFLRAGQVDPITGAPQQGEPLYALAPLLTNENSWSIHLVGGAAFNSANPLALQGAASLASQAANGGGSGDVVLDDPHFVNSYSAAPQPGLSVVRTGTGDLTISAGGNLSVASLYGIYTAGTQASDVSASFELARGTNGSGNVLQDSDAAVYEPYTTLATGASAGGYQAWYPTGGGNLTITAQGNVSGTELALDNNQTDEVGNWLWRQGGPNQNAAWFINFGTYTDIGGTNGSVPSTLALVGFTGFGTLGGGNLTLTAGGSATNIDAVVASTGRISSVTSVCGVVTGGAAPELTGGGTLTVSIGGTLGFNAANATTSSNGNKYPATAGLVIGNLRGPTDLSANVIANPMLVLGDSTAQVTARDSLAIGGVIDPTRVVMPFSTTWTAAATDSQGNSLAGASTRAYFSLWQPTTAVDLLAIGGNLMPFATQTSASGTSDLVANDLQILYPPTLIAAAASGDIQYSSNQFSGLVGTKITSAIGAAVELAPSPVGQLELLAAGNIDANAPASSANLLGEVAPESSNTLPGVLGSNGLGRAIDISGAPVGPDALSNPYRPAYTASAFYNGESTPLSLTNVTDTLLSTLKAGAASSLFAFEADTPAGALHANDPYPALVYAAGLNGVAGNITDFTYGETLQWKDQPNNYSAPAAVRQVKSDSNDGLYYPTVLATWYIGGKAIQVRAAGNIVAGGLPGNDQYASTLTQEFNNGSMVFTQQNLVVNNRAGDASLYQAGGNIYYATSRSPGRGRSRFWRAASSIRAARSTPAAAARRNFKASVRLSMSRPRTAATARTSSSARASLRRARPARPTSPTGRPSPRST
jgi:hypothetical protein